MPASARAAKRGAAADERCRREAFHDRFISFRTLGVVARLGWSELQARLDAGGIRPEGASARIYSRADIAHLLT